MNVSMLAINLGVMQIGTHVGVHIDFICPDIDVANSLHQEMLIKAEAAKLLAQLGFDTSDMEGIFEEMGYTSTNEEI